MNTDRNIINYIRLLPIVSIVLLMTFIMSVILNIQNNSLDMELEKMKALYMENQKKIIIYQVKQVKDYIEYELEKNTDSIENLQKKVLDRIINIRFGEKGYIYIVDSSGKLLAHRNKNIIGQNGFDIKDTNGFQYIKKGYDLAKKDGSTFIEYISVANADMYWNKEKKITYVEYFDKFSWAISAGVYTMDVDKILQKHIKQVKEKYTKENNLLITVSIVFALVVMFISMLLAKRIATIIKYKNQRTDAQNRQLAKIVKEKTSHLRHSLGFTNKLINTIPLPIFVKDQDLKYIDCNQAFCDFVGKSKKEIIGKSIEQVTSKELAAYNHEKDTEMLKQDIVYQNFKFIDHQEETKVYEFYKAKFLHKKKINGILGVIFDITQKELLAKSLKQEVAAKTIQNLNQSKKLEEEQLKNIKFTAIGQLAAGITHEINTPLTYIMGNFEMMGDDIETLPESDAKTRMKEDSVRINDGLKRIANIIESMREMSQKSKEEKEYVNIYHTLVTSLTMAYNRSKQISKITLNGKPFNMDCEKDIEVYNSFIQRQRVEQVWVIIVNNALDELVNVEGYKNRNLDITVGYNDKKDQVIIKFKDNAGGISSNMLDHIFEPFVSSKEYGGVGIGLNVAKKIIDEQRGEIIAYNEGYGAVFEIRLKNSDYNE